MGQNSCQPEGLQPESAMAALLVLAIERLLPSPGALPSPILDATHTCFIMLGPLRKLNCASEYSSPLSPSQLRPRPVRNRLDSRAPTHHDVRATIRTA